MLLLYTYYPPAQYNPTTINQVGRIRTTSDKVPFNQTLRFLTWREANSLPYSGVCVICTRHEYVTLTAGKGPAPGSKES